MLLQLIQTASCLFAGIQGTFEVDLRQSVRSIVETELRYALRTSNATCSGFQIFVVLGSYGRVVRKV